MCEHCQLPANTYSINGLVLVHRGNECAIDMTPKHSVLNRHNSKTNRKVQMYSNKQIHMDVDTIVSLVIQSVLVSEGGRISCCIMLIELRVKYETNEAMQVDQVETILLSFCMCI